MTDDEAPEESFAAVPADIAFDLREPQREVGDREEVGVGCTEEKRPRGGGEGDEEDNGEEEDELAVDGAEVCDSSRGLRGLGGGGTRYR